MFSVWQRTLDKIQDRIQQFGHAGAVRLCRLAVEAQRLLSDIGDAAALAFRHGHVLHCRFIQVAEIAQQVQQVGDRLQRIIDLVRDRCSEAPRRSQLLRLAQRFFALLAFADVLQDQCPPGASGCAWCEWDRCWPAT